MASSNGSPPQFGDRTREYPKGYGYCQCNCGQITRRNSGGEYAMYLSNHIGLRNESVPSRDIRKMPSRGPRLTGQAGAALESQSNAIKDDDWRLSGTVKYLYPDQAVLEEYTRLAQKFRNLTRTLEGAQADIERSIRAVDKNWDGEHESKTRVLEILRNALNHIKQAG